MNQFIIENPVLSIVISYIIGAVIMHITSVLAIRMAVEKEVGKALGEEEDLPDVTSFQPDRLLPIWLGKDEDGHCYLYFVEPQMHEAGTGPYAETVEGAYYTCDECAYIDIDELYKAKNSSIIYHLQKEFEKMGNLKYGTRKLYLCNRDVVEMINAIPGFH